MVFITIVIVILIFEENNTNKSGVTDETSSPTRSSTGKEGRLSCYPVTARKSVTGNTRTASSNG